MTTPAYIVFAHGSSVESANEAVRVVAAEMARRGGYSNVEVAFLEGGKPDLDGALQAAVARGAERVIIVPYFLTLGLHLRRDLPKLVGEARAKYPGIEIEVTPPLDGHPAMVEAL